MQMRALALCSILVVGAASLKAQVDAQVVLTRRDYAEHDRTFPQIWMADTGTLNFRQLTHSARDHSEPVCSRDGKLIYFASDRDAERSRDGYGAGGNREVWVYDKQTGQERLVWRTSREYGLDLKGVTATGGLLVRVGTELQSLLRNPWTIHNVDEAAVSPDGRRLALVIAESLFVADAATGQSRTELGKYSEPVWSTDGSRIAAFFDGGLAIIDARTRREMERVGLPKHDAAAQDMPQDIVWSPDGKSLLVGLYGENGGAGDPQNDYFLLNPVTRTWTPELTARRMLWLQPESVLYLRPYGTTPLAPESPHRRPHSVWTSDLALYDLASHKDTALISGLVLNDDLSTCGR